MATAANNPAGYYVGPPAMNSDEQKAPVPPAKKAVDDDINAPVQGLPGAGYYAGRVVKGKTDTSDQTSADAHDNGEPGFLAKCFVCFSGGGKAR